PQCCRCRFSPPPEALAVPPSPAAGAVLQLCRSRSVPPPPPSSIGSLPPHLISPVPASAGLRRPLAAAVRDAAASDGAAVVEAYVVVGEAGAATTGGAADNESADAVATPMLKNGGFHG
ncbi:unnamed protein product, partial [Urochloa humidicola]